MDVMTPGFRGLMKAARWLRMPCTTDYFLGRYAAMLEGWARECRREIEAHPGAEQGNRASARDAYHFGRLSMLCYREHVRRDKLGGRW